VPPLADVAEARAVSQAEPGGNVVQWPQQGDVVGVVARRLPQARDLLLDVDDLLEDVVGGELLDVLDPRAE
jgi:hypothetical protein